MARSLCSAALYLALARVLSAQRAQRALAAEPEAEPEDELEVGLQAWWRTDYLHFFRKFSCSTCSKILFDMKPYKDASSTNHLAIGDDIVNDMKTLGKPRGCAGIVSMGEHSREGCGLFLGSEERFPYNQFSNLMSTDGDPKFGDRPKEKYTHQGSTYEMEVSPPKRVESMQAFHFECKNDEPECEKGDNASQSYAFWVMLPKHEDQWSCPDTGCLWSPIGQECKKGTRSCADSTQYHYLLSWGPEVKAPLLRKWDGGGRGRHGPRRLWTIGYSRDSVFFGSFVDRPQDPKNTKTWGKEFPIMSWEAQANTRNKGWGNWAHIAVTYDAKIGVDGGGITFYVNGSKIAGGVPRAPRISVMKNNIGGGKVPPPTEKMEISQAYNGSYTREIRVYNKALTAGQVKSLYDQQARVPLPSKEWGGESVEQAIAQFLNDGDSHNGDNGDNPDSQNGDNGDNPDSQNGDIGAQEGP